MLSLFILIILFLPACKSLTEDEVHKWAQGNLEELNDYHLKGKLKIRDIDHDKLREYEIEERFLNPDKLRVDIFSENIEDQQIFITEKEEVSIFHMGLQEHYKIPRGELPNKLSFLFYEVIEVLANEETDVEVEQKDSNYLLTVNYNQKGIQYFQLELDNGLKPVKLKLYREVDRPPYAEVKYKKATLDKSTVTVDDFDEKLLKMAFKSHFKPSCQLQTFDKEDFSELSISFEPYLPKTTDYDLKSTHVCEVTNWVSMGFLKGNDTKENIILIQNKLDDDKSEFKSISELHDYEYIKYEEQELLYLDDKNFNMVTWMQTSQLRLIIISPKGLDKILEFVSSIK
ncbi:hypothetical protein [Natranaerobius trueperi]|uniref:Uncharacterized protein n=1 Tax=Natranaerobius trueperi TaxID=759412 RepID=A0A226BVA5_9FIRM|nr:hypothetical protein [Natranaerobius trueperi]OWZ82811.1 hypothetical protein CDO51_12070 [Natranaerobius trueperi]